MANASVEKGDLLGWLEQLYAQSEGEVSVIPWADVTPNPNFVVWLDPERPATGERKALATPQG
jgi:hypothetical protein